MNETKTAENYVVNKIRKLVEDVGQGGMVSQSTMLKLAKSFPKHRFSQVVVHRDFIEDPQLHLSEDEVQKSVIRLCEKLPDDSLVASLHQELEDKKALFVFVMDPDLIVVKRAKGYDVLLILSTIVVLK